MALFKTISEICKFKALHFAAIAVLGLSSFLGIATMDSENDAVRRIIADWKANDQLVLLAAGGIMVKVGNQNDISREELDTNKDVLAPIVRHMGPLT